MPYEDMNNNTPAEMFRGVSARMNEAIGVIQKLPERLHGVEARMSEIEQTVVGGYGGGRARRESPVDAFLADARFEAVAKGASSTGRVAVNASIGQVRAATLTSTGTAGGQYPVMPVRDGELRGFAQRPLSLLDLIPRIQVASNSFEFVQIGASYANGAGYQGGEGALKPEATIPLATVATKIATVAVWLRASAQLLDDVPALSSQLSTLLSAGLAERLEAELIGGAGTAPGSITGLLPQASGIVTTAAAPADRIGEAIASLAANGWRPGVAILHPLDWFGMRSERATDDAYIAGSWAAPAQPSIWSVPAITSSSLPRGTALVIDLSQTAILDRLAATIMLSREDSDNFTRNLITLLVEARAGLAVFAPAAIVKVTLA